MSLRESFLAQDVSTGERAWAEKELAAVESQLAEAFVLGALH